MHVHCTDQTPVYTAMFSCLPLWPGCIPDTICNPPEYHTQCGPSPSWLASTPSHITNTYSSMLFKNWPALLVPPSSGLATTAWTQSGTFSLIHLKFDTSIMALYLFAFLPKFLPKKLSPSASYILPASLLPFFSTHSHLTRQWRRAQHNPTQNWIFLNSLCAQHLISVFTQYVQKFHVNLYREHWRGA